MSAPTGAVRLTAWVHGHVQGVGFRWGTRSRALELGLIGYAANQADGRVLVVAEGTAANVDALLKWLHGGRTPGHVDLVVDDTGHATGEFEGFVER